MAQHRSSRSPATGTSTRARLRWVEPSAAEITDVIPFNEFGKLHDLDFRPNTAFDTDAQVLHAPELDDLHDVDNLRPLRLVAPGDRYADHPEGTDDLTHTDIAHTRVRHGHHRKPVAAGAAKSRLMVAAMAVGAAAAAVQSAINTADTQTAPTVLATGTSSPTGGAIDTTDGVQLIAVAPSAADAAERAGAHAAELVKSVAFAQERTQREARLARPLYVVPAQGIPTSGFGMRWGVLHGGVDTANAIGTPILAVTDGVVIDAGPVAGYGVWVKLRHADGTVTLYGHLNTTMVNIGERVMAGDQIATMGNTGNSTGPHLHLEVLLNGTDRVDPAPWLAKRGINVGGFKS